MVDRFVVAARLTKIRDYVALLRKILEIDRHRVYRALTTDLRDFESFIRAVTRLL